MASLICVSGRCRGLRPHRRSILCTIIRYASGRAGWVSWSEVAASALRTSLGALPAPRLTTPKLLVTRFSQAYKFRELSSRLYNRNSKNNYLSYVSVHVKIGFLLHNQIVTIWLLLTAMLICYDLDCYVVVHVYYAE